MSAVAYRLRLIVLEPPREPEEPRYTGDAPYERYERAKALLSRTARSAADYERGLRAIADREGV